MPYYHVFILYTDEKGQERAHVTWGLSYEFVREKIATPFMKNKAFMFGGRVVHPLSIDSIYIFESEEWDPDKIILLNGSPAPGHSFFYTTYCFSSGRVKGINDRTIDFVTSPPAKKEELITLSNQTVLMESASFLELDSNWFSATCALQLQEVAVTLVAKRKNIKLDKASVEKVLNKKIEGLSFNDQYDAFSMQVKDSFKIDMPILTKDFRKMRTKVLHQGYNPKPEETRSIVIFTTGLLKKLKDIS